MLKTIETKQFTILLTNRVNFIVLHNGLLSPCFRKDTLGNVSWNSESASAESGAAPEDTPMMLDRSYSFTSSLLDMKTTIDGTTGSC